MEGIGRLVSVALLLASFAGCRCGGSSASASDAAGADGAPEAAVAERDEPGRITIGGVSFVPPSGWARLDVSRLPEVPDLTTLVSFDGSTSFTRAAAAIARAPRGSAWTRFAGPSQIFSKTERWVLAESTEREALFTATFPEPWIRREHMRWFVVDRSVVMFACELVDDAQQALCDAQLARLQLGATDAGPEPFRFEGPEGWSRERAPSEAWPGEMFTPPDTPGFRVSVGSSHRCAETSPTCAPPRATLDYLASIRWEPDAGSITSSRRITRKGIPGLELMFVRPRKQLPLALHLTRVPAPTDDVVVVCGGTREREVESACEALAASVRVR